MLVTISPASSRTRKVLVHIYTRTSRYKIQIHICTHHQVQELHKIQNTHTARYFIYLFELHRFATSPANSHKHMISILQLLINGSKTNDKFRNRQQTIYTGIHNLQLMHECCQWTVGFFAKAILISVNRTLSRVWLVLRSLFRCKENKKYSMQNQIDQLMCGVRSSQLIIWDTQWNPTNRQG